MIFGTKATLWWFKIKKILNFGQVMPVLVKLPNMATRDGETAKRSAVHPDVRQPHNAGMHVLKDGHGPPKGAKGVS